MRLLRNIVFAAILAGSAFVAYLYFSAGTGEPSTDLTTPVTGPVGENTFVIDPELTTASFTLTEVLRGEHQTVVGTTSQVSGQVEVDPAEPAGVRIGQILINARTFKTDSTNRDRAMRSPIVLDSGDDAHELISFLPTAVGGLTTDLVVGLEVDFTVTGDLTIKDTTNPVTFDVTVTLESDDSISGQAQATVNRSDFGIGIPNAPGVANVSEAVGIELSFVAVRR